MRASGCLIIEENIKYYIQYKNSRVVITYSFGGEIACPACTRPYESGIICLDQFEFN